MKAVSAKLQLGTAFSMSNAEPASSSPEDAAAAERFHAIGNCWFLHTALKGEYPAAFPSGVPAELMGIQAGDMETVKAPFDFLGINYYFRQLVAHEPDDAIGPQLRTVGLGGVDGPLTDIVWE